MGPSKPLVEKVGSFDVVLFLGVLYHLPSLLTALQQVSTVAKECLIVETRVGMMWKRKPALTYHPGNTQRPDKFFIPIGFRDRGFAGMRLVAVRFLLHRQTSHRSRLARNGAPTVERCSRAPYREAATSEHAIKKFRSSLG